MVILFYNLTQIFDEFSKQLLVQLQKQAFQTKAQTQFVQMIERE
ncbi:hypothetical protein pb186bvf_018026 [Paramecium bursaria]